MNNSFSLESRSSSIIFSTPFLPITAGTPIVTSEYPYSPSRYVATGIICFVSLTTASIIDEIAFPGACTVAPFNSMTLAATCFVSCTISSSFDFDKSDVSGIPDTVEYLEEATCFHHVHL